MMKGRLKYWILGTLSAFSGVGLVKVLAPLYSGNVKTAVMLAGYTLAILGLFIITLGTRRTDSD
jgi:hypothetical protein